jgi:hypothetical protein
MTENFTAPADMTEEQAKVEVEKMATEIRFLLAQIKRDREEGERITARSDAKMAEVRAALERFNISRSNHV